jgi:hypothetical protein
MTIRQGDIVKTKHGKELCVVVLVGNGIVEMRTISPDKPVRSYFRKQADVKVVETIVKRVEAMA